MTWSDRADRWVRARPVVPDAVLAVVIAAIVGPTSLSILEAAQTRDWSLWVAGICGAVVTATVALRRIAPEVGFLLASSAMAVTVALPNAVVRPDELGLLGSGEHMEIALFFIPSSAVFLVHLHAVAARCRRRTSLLALGVGLAGALLCTAKTATAYGALPAGWLTLLLALLALGAAVAGAWIVGRFQFDRRQRLAAEAAEAVERAAADERQRIARDMHDIVAHSLAVIVRQAEGGSAIAAKSPERAAQALSVIADAAREALADMRGTLQVLRGATPREASTPSLAELPALVERVRATGVDVRLTERGPATVLTPSAGVAAYRLVQEALTNSVKHAGSRPEVAITVERTPEALVVLVEDDGGVAEDRPAVPGAGVGLRGVQERVHAAGGAFEAGPVGGGFRVRAEFPVSTRKALR
ncbi:hypothetical protein GCM10022247_06580 [Allokutzneria multivorans]|uniref:histidine kinase n=1 Tax=Allokutzneria multivorans TaxID=1142134 RepID=A0ABP7R0K1_9PSEU